MHNVDVRNVSLGQIMYFVKVAETLNVTMTAEYYHLTQPALSKKLASLEQQLDLQLFIRTNRIASLTPAGKYLYEKWKHVVSHIEEDIQQAHVLQTGRTQSLVVACMDSFRPDLFLIPSARSFQEKYPNIHLRIETDAVQEIRRLLQNEEADLIISILYDFEERDMEHITCRYLGKTPHCVCMKKTNPLAQKDTLTMEDLKWSDFICLSPYTLPEYVRMLHRLCEPFGYVPNISSYVSSASSLTMNIRNDNEVFICDRYYTDNNPADHALIPIADTESGIVIAWRKDNRKQSLHDYIDILEQYL